MTAERSEREDMTRSSMRAELCCLPVLPVPGIVPGSVSKGPTSRLARLAGERSELPCAFHSSVSSERFEVRQNLGISLANVYPMLSSPFIL
jgi:hypothetical protein